MDDNELKKYFGKLIRSNRIEQKITQKQLASLAGISTTYLRGIEYGKHSITWRIWLKISIALQLDINDLINKVRIDSD